MKEKLIKYFKEFLPYIGVIVLALMVKAYIAAPIMVNGDSMDDTLKDGDYMILNKLSYKIGSVERFDIVVVKYRDEDLIKRVIGLPGEKVEFRDNLLYINGKKIEEKFSHGKTDDFSVVVPKNKYFVMGDNREVSMDSRVFGSFSLKKVEGKASFVILPFDRFGRKK